jgi:hypothetical protein
MIKFHIQTETGKSLFGFGLTACNVAKLIQGEPLFIDLREMDGPNAKVLIMYGPDEETVFDTLKEKQLFPEDLEFTPPEAGQTMVVRMDNRRKPRGDHDT